MSLLDDLHTGVFVLQCALGFLQAVMMVVVCVVIWLFFRWVYDRWRGE